MTKKRDAEGIQVKRPKRVKLTAKESLKRMQEFPKRGLRIGANSSSKETVCHPFEQSIRRRLSKIKDVDAVFISTDDDGLVHVYSVVPEYHDDMYGKLLKQERLVEKELPEMKIEFHVRAHQGREPFRAVPFGSQPLFMR